MKTSFPLFTRIAAFMLGAVLAASAQGVRIPSPIISHQPVEVATPGKAINVVATVGSKQHPVKEVYLHFTPSRDTAPDKVRMTPTGVGAYYGSIPDRFTQGHAALYYYIDAANTAGEWAETPWYTIQLQGAPIPARTRAQDPDSITRKGWFWPAIIGGSALLIGGGIALSDSGGGGGGGSSSTTAISDQVVTRGASDSASGSGLSFPNETAIDASSAIGTRTIRSVKINLEYQPIDGLPEQFKVIYNNATVLDTGAVTASGSREVLVQGASPIVFIQVSSSEANEDGDHFYSWNVTATFFLN